MTRSTNARVAGVAYLAYIAVGIMGMLLTGRATAGGDMAAKLATMAGHEGDVRLAAILGLVSCLCAFVLAVTLYSVTRDEDRDVALFGLTCRVAEGITGAVGIPATLALLSLAMAGGGNAPAMDGTQAVAALVLRHSSAIGAWFFAVGSTAFCWLLLRGRMIPLVLAWLGVVASVLLVIALPLQIGAVMPRSLTQIVWLPMAAFEIPVAIWFIVKGIAGTGQGGVRAP